jgi:hypothetical protein
MVKMGNLSLKQKPIRLLIIITLALIISAPIVLPHQVAAQTSGYYNRSFSWDYNGKHWDWNLSIPQNLYEAYKSVPDSTRISNGPAGYDMMTTTQDSYIQSLAQRLNATTTQLGYNSYDQANFVLAFVQSIPYSSDFNTTGYEEYPRFPIETLVDQTGDCDCKAILYATLILTLGDGAVFINPTDHLAVGVLGNELHGTYWTHNNQTYYYAETTGIGFTIGQLPDEFQGQTALICDIDPSKQYVPNIAVTSTDEPSLTNGQSISTLPTPTAAPIGPNPTSSASPNISGPSIQPVMPLSVNLIADDPILFIIIIFAIVVSITLAVWSVRKPKHLPVQAPVASEPSNSQEETTSLDGNKFCIFCGSSNKAYAEYCEKCGKQIGQPSV